MFEHSNTLYNIYSINTKRKTPWSYPTKKKNSTSAILDPFMSTTAIASLRGPRAPGPGTSNMF